MSEICFSRERRCFVEADANECKYCGHSAELVRDQKHLWGVVKELGFRPDLFKCDSKGILYRKNEQKLKLEIYKLYLESLKE